MTDDTRELGVELGDLRERLDSHDFPASHDDLLEHHGDVEVGIQDGTVTVEELIGPLNQDEYTSPDDVEQAVLNMVGDEAIGRKGYSDRTPPATGEDRQDESAPDQEGQREQESF